MRRPDELERTIPNAEDAIEERKPPLEWFYGIGLKDRGIIAVGVSKEFCSLGGGIVGEIYDEWAHYNGNPPSPDEST